MAEARTEVDVRAVVLCGIAAALLALTPRAAPAGDFSPAIYHSPGDDGARPAEPEVLPGPGPHTLHLYLDGGSTPSAPEERCLVGAGHEICGFAVALEAEGNLSLRSFSPEREADRGIVWNLDSDRLRVIGGDFLAGELGPTRLGALVVQGEGSVAVRAGQVLDSALREVAIPDQSIARVPEPAATLRISAILLALAWLRKHRRRRRPARVGSALLATCLVALPALPGRAQEPADAGSSWLPGRLVVKLRTTGPHAVSERAHRLLAEGRSFRSASRDDSDSLDVLMKRHGVRSAVTHYFPGESRADEARGHYRRLVERSEERFAARRMRAEARRPGTARPRSDPTSVYVLLVDPATDLVAACGEFGADPHVVYCEPDWLRSADAPFTPNDPLFPQSWALENAGIGGVADADIDATDAWGIQRGSRDVVVAIIDSGVDWKHPDLHPNVWRNPLEAPGDANGDGFPGVAGVDDDGDGLVDEDRAGAQPGDPGYANDLAFDDDENGFIDDIIGWDFRDNDNRPDDESGHGTSVAGIIGAVGHNDQGSSGVSPAVQLMPLRFLGASGEGGSSTHSSRAVDYAALMGADVINASYGGTGASVTEREAIERAEAMGVLFVAAAGNDGVDTDADPHYPSSYEVESLVAVGATDRFDDRAVWSATRSSNFGPTSVDLAAPGKANRTTASGGDYRDFNGTSSAAPHVSGAAALLLAQDPALAPADVKALLLATVDPVAEWQGASVSGGRLNAGAAVTQAQAAQELGAVGGTVLDADTLAPIVGARVRRAETGQEVLADAAGRWSLRSPTGAVTLEFEAFGYTSQLQALALASDPELVVDAALDPIPRVAVSGRVIEEGSEERIAAEIRFFSRGLEVAFVDQSLATDFVVSLPPGTYDVEIVPDDFAYPERFLFGVEATGGAPLVFALPLRGFAPGNAAAGLVVPDARSVAWGDFDGDGHHDIYLGVQFAQNELHRNLGDGTFQKVNAGVESARRTVSVAWGDFDADGDPDLFAGSFGDHTGPGGGAPDELYRNEGGHFSEVAEGLGLVYSQSVGFGVWTDFDRDGRLDLVASYTQAPSRYLRQQVDGTFEDTFMHDLLVTSSNARVVPAFADYDGDGDSDLVLYGKLLRNDDGALTGPILDFIEVTGAMEENPGWADYDGDGDLDLLFPGDRQPARLYRNDGGDVFTDVAAESGVLSDGTHHRRAQWADVDNDGDLDALLTTPFSLFGANRVTLYENDGDGGFTDATESWGIRRNVLGTAAGFCDFDRDGDLDLFHTDTLYINRGNDHHWLQLDLVGTVSATDAIGARVLLRAGGKLQLREVTGESGSCRRIHFGLGSVDQLESLEIRWPTGATLVLTEVAVDRILTVVEKPDTDLDGVPDETDNCVFAANADQQDLGGVGSGSAPDGRGDACQCGDANEDGTLDEDDEDMLAACASGSDPGCDPALSDTDDDGLVTDVDRQRLRDVLDGFLESDALACLRSTDADGDGANASFDNCPADPNPGQEDGDRDDVGDSCDACPADPINDGDGDEVCGLLDNCPFDRNADQADLDGDGAGDVCDSDADDDGFENAKDNCPLGFNPAQNDLDGDDVGNVCDACPRDEANDTDGDGWCDGEDVCPALRNPGQRDADADGLGDVCDSDLDGDGVVNEIDTCPGVPNPVQSDFCTALSLLGSYVHSDRGALTSVEVVGSRAYALASSELVVVDVADPKSPTLLGAVAIPAAPSASANDLVIRADTAYVATETAIRMADVSDPADMAFFDFVGIPEAVGANGQEIERRGDLIYLGTQAGIGIFDAAQPGLPLVGSTGGIAWTRALRVHGDLVYHLQGSGVFTSFGIFDVSAPGAIRRTDALRANFMRHFDVEAGRALLVGEFETHVMDVSNPDEPTLLHVDARFARNVTDSRIIGNRAYLAETNTAGLGVQIWDVSDPFSLTRIDHIPTDGLPRGLAFEGGRIYVLDDAELEVWAVGDLDGDGIDVAFDNCPFHPNPDQRDTGGSGGVPDGHGDACQCGDVTGDGSIGIGDVVRIERMLAGVPPRLLRPEKCNATGAEGGALADCDADDVAVLKRAIVGLPNGVAQICGPALP